MNEKRRISQRLFRIIFAGMLLISFHSSSAVAQTSTPTPTLISGVLACNTVAAGVTCTNHGTYLDYSLNIVVTGLTGGTTASDIFIGTYTRSTSGGYMGMMSDFVHSETSVYPDNTVLSFVGIQPFDASGMGYASFTSAPGTNVNVTNQTSDWRYIGGSGGWPNYLSVKGNVDWAITGYSIVGHIYLYSNQNFALPTFTPTATPTPSSYILNLQPDAANGMDTLIHNAAATTNYGTSTTLSIGEINNQTNRITRSLIKFNLSSIPANATITSATMSLWTAADYSSNTRTIGVYRLKRPFTETQATWNIAQTGINWQTAGASGANDRETTSIGSVQILANEPLNTQKQISLNPAKIQEFINGAFTNNGFILIVNTELNDRFDYKSSDNTTAAQRPKLVINYTVPFMTATPTLTPTFTPTSTPTATFTPTPTITPTNTFIPGTPHDHGSGTCWRSAGWWSGYGATYNFHSSLPSTFESSIDASAQTWNDVFPSSFSFNRSIFSTYLVRYEVPLDNPDYVAGTIASPSTGPFNFAVTRLNPNKTWDTNIPPASNTHSVQAVMTHEFGHWIFLGDIYRVSQPGCTHVTMDEVINPGDFGEITLASEDENGINWQYP